MAAAFRSPMSQCQCPSPPISEPPSPRRLRKPKSWSGPCATLDLAEACYLSEPQFPCQKGLLVPVLRGSACAGRASGGGYLTQSPGLGDTLRAPQKGLHRKVLARALSKAETGATVLTEAAARWL